MKFVPNSIIYIFLALLLIPFHTKYRWRVSNNISLDTAPGREEIFFYLTKKRTGIFVNLFQDSIICTSHIHSIYFVLSWLCLFIAWIELYQRLNRADFIDTSSRYSRTWTETMLENKTSHLPQKSAWVPH